MPWAHPDQTPNPRPPPPLQTPLTAAGLALSPSHANTRIYSYKLPLQYAARHTNRRAIRLALAARTHAHARSPHHPQRTRPPMASARARRASLLPPRTRARRPRGARGCADVGHLRAPGTRSSPPGRAMAAGGTRHRRPRWSSAGAGALAGHNAAAPSPGPDSDGSAESAVRRHAHHPSARPRQPRRALAGLRARPFGSAPAVAAQSRAPPSPPTTAAAAWALPVAVGLVAMWLV